MRFLLFDRDAISTYVSKSTLQSIEYSQGLRFAEHICGKHSSEIFEETAIEYVKDGIIFSGKKRDNSSDDKNDGRNIFCIDLTQCNILSEANNLVDLLTLIQKAFRLTIKIWSRQPFSNSERVHGSKSILFPFPLPDHRRLVLERSNSVLRLEKRGIKFPLLAYKYNAEDPPQAEDTVDTAVLKLAGERYLENYVTLQSKIHKSLRPLPESNEVQSSLEYLTATEAVGQVDFIYMDYERQRNLLTNIQQFIVDYESIKTPLRVEGAAGTGKTISLILRAYRLLSKFRKENKPFNIVFFAHSESTSQRNEEAFRIYEDSEYYLSPTSPQHIFFTTLFTFCRKFAGISETLLLEKDAFDSKSYQLMLIDSVLANAREKNQIRTFYPLLSENMQELFNEEKTTESTLCAMLQHEFSIQIKGRTDGTIEQYCELLSIKNGVPCMNKKDKELIFLLYNAYQYELQMQGTYDTDDIAMEALSRFNGPIWRRERVQKGYDYIIVDEMHLFNINEQSVFHYLTKDFIVKDVPICFALDYGQAIGDRGSVDGDYIQKAFGNVTERKLQTVFRNSPQITDLCAAIAASGTMMFGENFANPYQSSQNSFTDAEEKKCSLPSLRMYDSEESMLDSISNHIKTINKTLQCKKSDIAVISFDQKYTGKSGAETLTKRTGMSFDAIDNAEAQKGDNFILASPYAINGLEFSAVILLGVDEGRVPQTAGTGDVSQHYIKYSAYNMLYLAVSRAKYIVTVLGSKLNGQSSCLNHAIESGKIILEKTDGE